MVIFLQIMILILLIFVLRYLYIITNILNRNKFEYKNEISTTKNLDKDQLELTNQGYYTGQQIESFYAYDIELKQEIFFEMNREKELILFITGVGCSECLKSLGFLAQFDLKNTKKEVVILSFQSSDYAPPIEDIEEHFSYVNKLDSIKHYVIAEKTLIKLRLTEVPVIIKADKDGISQGTYYGFTDNIANIFENERR